MNIDPKNQNYFALNEPMPVILPWWKERKHQMRMLGVFGVLIGVGLIGYYAYQTYSLTHVDIAKVEQAKNMLMNAAASCAAESDPAACEARARSSAARATGQASVCDGLVEKAFMNCVTLIAMDTANPDVCAVLSGNEESQCTDSAMLRAAKQNENYGLCVKIGDEKKRISCQSQLLEFVIARGECAKFGIDAGVCAYPELLKTVLDRGDISGCAQFIGDQNTQCLFLFTTTDQDGDGLTRDREFILGTSDTKADTDGDGYTDAQEIASGHDPLK